MSKEELSKMSMVEKIRVIEEISQMIMTSPGANVREWPKHDSDHFVF